MPALANVVLTDGSATDHTFVPQAGVDAKGVARLERTTGVPIGNEVLTISSGKTPAGRRKATLKLTVPILQNGVVDGISRPTVVRSSYATIEFSFDGSSSKTERTDVRKMIVDLLGDGQTLAAAVIDDLEGLY